MAGKNPAESAWSARSLLLSHLSTCSYYSKSVLECLGVRRTADSRLLQPTPRATRSNMLLIVNDLRLHSGQSSLLDLSVAVSAELLDNLVLLALNQEFGSSIRRRGHCRGAKGRSVAQSLSGLLEIEFSVIWQLVQSS